MAAAAAVLRSAASGAVPPAYSFWRTRLFSSIHSKTTTAPTSREVVAGSAETPRAAVLPPPTIKPEAKGGRKVLTVEEAYQIRVQHAIAMRSLGEAVRDTIRRDRRNRVLLRASILGGGAIYMVHRFFFRGTAGQADDRKTTGGRDYI